MNSRAAAVLVMFALAFALPARAADGKAGGKALFTTKCALCHGAEGKRKPVIQKSKAHDFDDAAWQKEVTDEQLHKTITEGRPGTLMRAFGKELTPAQIDALVAYVRTFAPKS
jgi:cytochrome c oxidase cbb3-type subunit III